MRHSIKRYLMAVTPTYKGMEEIDKMLTQNINFKIGSDADGNIVFPFYRDNELVFVKYRAPRKPQGKERKEWQAPGTRPILFGMDLCSFSQP